MTVLGYVSLPVGIVASAMQIAELFPAPSIDLQLADNVVVPRCLVLQGSAPYRDGATLVEAHHSASNRYYFNRVVRTHDDNFTVTSNVGGAKTEGTYVLEVFYVDTETADFVLGLDGTGAAGDDDGQAFASRLPPGAVAVERRTVRRVPDSGSC